MQGSHKGVEGAVTTPRHRSDPQRSVALHRDRLPRAKSVPAGALLAGEKRILEMIATRQRLGAILDTLAEWLEEHSAGGRCHIFEVDPTGTRLRVAAAPSSPADYSRAISDQAIIAPVSLPCGVAVFRREPVLAMDWSRGSAFAPYGDVAKRYGVAAVWAVPVCSRSGEVLGAVGLAYRSWGPLQARDRKLLETSMRLAGIALERHRKDLPLSPWGAQPLRAGVTSRDDRDYAAVLQDGLSTAAGDRTEWGRLAEERNRLLAGQQSAIAEAAKRRRRLNFLAEASTLLASSQEYQTGLTRLAELAVSQVGDCCVVSLFAGDTIAPWATVAHRDPAMARRCRELLLEHGGDGEGRGLQAPGGTSLVATLEEWPAALASPLPRPVLELLGARSLLRVPIQARGRILGYITLITASAACRYGDEDLLVAEDLARRVATAVDNACLEAAVQEATSQRNQALVQLQAEQALLATLFRHAPAFVGILWGPRHAIELVSDGYRKLLRRRGGMGKPLVEAFPEAQSQGLIDMLDQVYATGIPHVGHEVPVLVGRGRDGRRRPRQRWINYVVQPLRTSGGLIDGLLVFATDVTAEVTALHEIDARNAEIRSLNAELEQRVQQRTAQLEAANRELEAFSYSVSHDLRAPLRAIIGFSQVLLEDYGAQLDANGQMYVERLQAASQRMALLMDQLLDLSRLSRRPLSIESVNLSHLACSILQARCHAGPDRQVTWRVQPGLVVQGDAVLLRVAMENLLGNAWKFTAGHERATIEFGALQRAGNVVFFVRDDGAGFDMANASRLFGAFQRLHGPDEFPGTGIGLAMVQRIINRHGGRVWAEAWVEQGATFYFALGPER